MSKILKNNSGSNISIADTGITIDDNTQYTISPHEYGMWADSGNVVTQIGSGNLVVSDGSVDLSISQGIDLIKGIFPKSVSITGSTSTISAPFVDKILSNGKKLYRRVIGVPASVQNALVTTDYTITIPVCKITGVEVIGAVLGDRVDFQVLDTAAGAITGVPNYLLNEFGTGVYMAPDLHKFMSEYDADLFGGLVVRIRYLPADTGASRSVYFNLILHELKD